MVRGRRGKMQPSECQGQDVADNRGVDINKKNKAPISTSTTTRDTSVTKDEKYVRGDFSSHAYAHA